MRAFLLIFLCVLTGPALATEQLQFEPAPDWLRSIEAPVEATSATRGQALAIRLIDSQFRIDEDGALAVFQHTAIQVNDASALQSAGTVAVSWQPLLQEARVHSVEIHRGSDAIDVLTGGAAFETLQRETQLEQGFISGELTAVLAIPGLRVGDRVEVRSSLVSRDPALQEHMELLAALPVGLLADRIHMQLSWPHGQARNLTMGREWSAAERVRDGDRDILTLDIAGANLPMLPPDAPARFAREFMATVSDHNGWSGVSRLFAPSYDRAATIAAGGSLSALAARIATENDSPEARAEAALKLVQRDVRYLFRNYDLGGMTPRTAEQVWDDRQGDCKGKSVLLVALLRELGIDAEPALVRAVQSGLLDQTIPAAMWFDHVIVRARIDGRIYWLDGTGIGDGLESGLTPPRYRHALPLTAKGSDLISLPNAAPAKPANVTSVDIDMSAGLDSHAAVTGSLSYDDDYALGLDLALRQAGEARREDVLTQFAASQMGWIEIESAVLVQDEAGATRGISFAGTADLDWNLAGQTGRYDVPYSRLGRDFATKRQVTGIYADVPTQSQAEFVESSVKLRLPAGDGRFTLDGKTGIDRTIGPARYRRKAELSDNVLTLTSSTIVTPMELALADAKAADEDTDDLWDERLYIRVAERKVAAADLAGGTEESDPAGLATALLAGDPVEWTKADYRFRFEKDQAADVLAKLDALDDSAASTEAALSMRTVALSLLDRADEASRANERLLARHPTSYDGLGYRYSLLLGQRRFQDAEIVMDRMILSFPAADNVYAWRARSRAAQANYEGAASDLAIHLERQPDDISARIFETEMLTRLKRSEAALSKVEGWLADHPNDTAALGLKAKILINMDRKDDARTLARDLVSEELGNGAMLILHYDLWETFRERRDALFALLDTNPANLLSLVDKLDAVLSDPDARIAYFRKVDELDTAARASPGSEIGPASTWWYPFLRAAAGDRKQADALLDGDLTEDQRNWAGTLWNNLCWARATAGTGLDEARSDCMRALAINRYPAYLDSLALVDLQAGNAKAALALYDEALAGGDFASARYGRGLALHTLGRTDEAAADFQNAEAAYPGTAESYWKYGIVPDELMPETDTKED
ncbi:MAG: DUF3857 domain-containing protein [Pacificimonas sp.]